MKRVKALSIKKRIVQTESTSTNKCDKCIHKLVCKDFEILQQDPCGALLSKDWENCINFIHNGINIKRIIITNTAGETSDWEVEKIILIRIRKVPFRDEKYTEIKVINKQGQMESINVMASSKFEVY